MAPLALALLALLPTLPLPQSSGAPRAESAPRPNVLFVFSDDHATAAISAYGSRVNRTPHLDRLAAEGLRFDATFCTNSICAPSRAVVLSGLHSPFNGVRDNGGRLRDDLETFPERLRAAGYQTALFGKWHLKADPRGFDRWEVLPGQGHYYNPDLRSPAGTRRVEGHVTAITTDLALRWLAEERDRERPFLLMVQHKAPHRAWRAAPEHLALFQDVTLPEPPTLFDDYATRSDAARRQEMEIARHLYPYYDLKLPPVDPEAELEGPDRWTAEALDRMTPEQRATFEAAYAAENAAFRAAPPEGRELVRWKYQRYLKDYLRCVAGVDDSVGRLLEQLDALGLAEDTVVVYSSDQGFYLGEHGWYDKRFMYEPSLRMPLLVRWPGVVEPGSVDTHLTQNLDFAPTFLELAGLEPPAEFQGASLVPLLRGEDPEGWREVVYYEYFERGIHAVEPHRGVRDARHKLIHFHTLDQWELYDLETDPHEVANRWDDPELAAVRERLVRELERQRAAFGAVD